MHETLDREPVLFDQIADVAGAHAGLRTGVFDSASEANVVAQVVDTFGNLEQFVDVGLLHLEPTVEVAALVWSVAF